MKNDPVLTAAYLLLLFFWVMHLVGAINILIMAKKRKIIKEHQQLVDDLIREP